MKITLIGLLAGTLVFMLIIGIASYFISKGKTVTPLKSAVLGAVFSIVPILGIIYIGYLVSKENLPTNV